MNYQEVIATNRSDWQQEAEQLAAGKIAFVIVGWSFSFDNEFCQSLAKKSGYKYRFDHMKDRAFMEPI